MDGIYQRINGTEDKEDADLEPSVQRYILQKPEFLSSASGILERLGLISKECSLALFSEQCSLRAVKVGSGQQLQVSEFSRHEKVL